MGSKWEVRSERTKDIPLIREGLVAVSILLSPAALAQSPELESLAALPPSCSALLQNKGGVDTCRTDMTTQSEQLKTFISSGGLGKLAFFKGGITAVERCKMALSILEPRIAQLKELEIFLEEEARLPDSKAALWKLFPGTVRELSRVGPDNKVIEPTPQFLVGHLKAQIPQLPDRLKRCSGGLYAALSFLGIGYVREGADKRTVVLTDELIKGIHDTTNRERLKASVATYVRLLELLREAAKMPVPRQNR